MRVGVIMGGKSVEREVSLNSGRTVCDHLDTSRYDIIPIFQTEKGDLFLLPWHFLHRGKITDFRHRLADEAKKICWDDLKTLVDFIFLAMHGKFAEDGTAQGFLEILGIPYLGSKVFGSALGMDKIIQKDFLKANNIEVAKGIAVYPHQIKHFDEYKNTIYKQLETTGINFPCIIKPNQEGSSLGVEVINKKEDLQDALLRSSTTTPGFYQPVLIEEQVKGKEISCCLVTDHKTGEIIPLAPTEIIIEQGKKIFDYEQKYMPGRGHEYTPARCSEKEIKQIQQACIKVMQILGITNTARIDGFLTNNGNFIIIDPNTLTGMGPASFFFREAAELNINHTQLINHLIETELSAYGMLNKILIQEKKQAKTMTEKKIRVAVLFGGNTNEKEISLESGRNVIYKLSPQKYEPIPVFVSKNMELYKINNKQLVRNSTAEIEELLEAKEKLNWSDLPNIADFVFIGLHGGHGENGAVQGACEMLSIPYNGPRVLASALCADKFKTNEFLKNKGFDVPKSLLLAKEEWILDQKRIIEQINTDLFFPCIVKPHDDGCSMMVEKIKDEKQLKEAIDTFFTSKKTHIMIEEMIHGMELTIGVIGNHQPRALIPSQAVASQGILSIEEKFLPGAGENQTPAPLNEKALKLVQRINEEAYRTTGCKGYSRIDCFYQSATESPTKKERVVILEINTLPGLTPATCIFHQAAELGIKPMDFIDMIITLGLEEHTKQNIPVTKIEKIKPLTTEKAKNMPQPETTIDSPKTNRLQ